MAARGGTASTSADGRAQALQDVLDKYIRPRAQAHRYMTVGPDDHPFTESSAYHSNSSFLYLFVDQRTWTPHASSPSQLSNDESLSWMVEMNRRLMRIFGFIAMSMSTYERQLVDGDYAMTIATMTQVPHRQNPEQSVGWVFRVSRAKGINEDSDLDEKSKLYYVKLRKRQEQRDPEYILNAVLNANAFRKVSEMRNETKRKTGFSKDIQDAKRNEAFQQFMTKEEYVDTCAMYMGGSVDRLDKTRASFMPVHFDDNPANPYRVFTLEVALRLMKQAGAAEDFLDRQGWESHYNDQATLIGHPDLGRRTYRVRASELEPTEFPGFLFPNIRPPDPMPGDKMFEDMKRQCGLERALDQEDRDRVHRDALVLYKAIQAKKPLHHNRQQLRSAIAHELKTSLARAESFAEQCEIRERVQTKAIDEFFRIVHPGGDVPDSIKAMMGWMHNFLSERKTFRLPRERMSTDLTHFGETQAYQLLALEKALKVHANHRIVATMLYLQRSVYLDEPMKINLCLLGEHRVGKSFYILLVIALCVAGTCKSFSYASAAADRQESSDSFNYTTECWEEAPPEFLAGDQSGGNRGSSHSLDNAGQSTAASQFRDRLTSSKINWKTSGYVDGMRFPAGASIEAHVGYMFGWNGWLSQIPPNMLSRMVAFVVNQIERVGENVAHKKLSQKRADAIVQSLVKRMGIRNMRNQCFAMLLSFMTQDNVLRKFTTDATDAVFIEFMDLAVAKGLPLASDSRHFDRERMLMLILAMDDLTNWFLDSHESPIADKTDWNWQYMKLMEPRMITTIEHCASAIEMLSDQYENQQEFFILNAFRKKYANQPEAIPMVVNNKVVNQRPIGMLVEGHGPPRPVRTTDAEGLPVPAVVASSSSSSSSVPASPARPRLFLGMPAEHKTLAGATPATHPDLVREAERQAMDLADDVGDDKRPTADEKAAAAKAEADRESNFGHDKAYLVCDFKKVDNGDRHATDRLRCEKLAAEISELLDSKKRISIREMTNYFLSLMAQHVPGVTDPTSSLPVLAFVGSRALMARCILDNNREYRVRQCLHDILRYQHIPVRRYVLGASRDGHPWISPIIDNKLNAAELKLQEEGKPIGRKVLRVYNPHFMSEEQETLLSRLCSDEAFGRFDDWHAQEMHKVMSRTPYYLMDVDPEAWAVKQRLALILWSPEHLRRLRYPGQPDREPDPILIPQKLDERHLENAKARNVTLYEYPKCFDRLNSMVYNPKHKAYHEEQERLHPSRYSLTQYLQDMDQILQQSRPPPDLEPIFFPRERDGKDAKSDRHEPRPLVPEVVMRPNQDDEDNSEPEAGLFSEDSLDAVMAAEDKRRDDLPFPIPAAAIISSSSSSSSSSSAEVNASSMPIRLSLSARLARSGSSVSSLAEPDWHPRSSSSSSTSPIDFTEFNQSLAGNSSSRRLDSPYARPRATSPVAPAPGAPVSMARRLRRLSDVNS